MIRLPNDDVRNFFRFFVIIKLITQYSESLESLKYHPIKKKKYLYVNATDFIDIKILFFFWEVQGQGGGASEPTTPPT